MIRRCYPFGLRCLCLFAVGLCFTLPCRAQDRSPVPRLGGGADILINPNDDQLAETAVGVGFRLRGSLPMTTRLSLAAGFGFATFISTGDTEAEYVVNPQISGITTFEGNTWWPYALAGIGGYFPISTRDAARGGFALQAGYGYARLLEETSVFIELNPALILRDDRATLVIPFRVGLIF